MNSTQFVRQIESEDLNSLQISKLTLNSRVDQESIIQADLSGDNIFCYLNLSDSTQKRECSCDVDKDPQQVRTKTKKDNFIIKNQNFQQQQEYVYECGYCLKIFPYFRSLGGHVQKNHRIEKNQNATISSIRLRIRPVRNGQH
ncbi:unnamed protein product [Paramecium sonneborni]|uniref:C2H2-type domain-containing protein n=1 Tax=Paramecium sonneborni TaxID=65129 RepID=A0A8S1M781_9CILI|nr:unnamed protein product [Paramecium sonneborni]